MVMQPKLAYLDLIKARGREYAYYRRGGMRQRIDGDVGTAEWLESYARIHASFEDGSTKRKADDGTLAALIEDYYTTPRFQRLADSSKERYRFSLDKLRSNLGTVQINDITRGIIVRLRDRIAETKPKDALEIVKVIRVVFEHARDCDLVDRNPAAGVSDPLNYVPKPHRPWTDDEIETFQAKAKPIWRRAMMVLLYTGLRRGDAIMLERKHIADGVIPWVVQKTKTNVVIPVHSDLAEELSRPLPVESMYLICGARGHRLSGTAVTQGLMRQCQRLGIDPWPPLHGLRKNAVMRLLEAGCTEEMVNAVTGQSKEMIRHYGQAFDRTRLAKAAILKLERKT